MCEPESAVLAEEEAIAVGTSVSNRLPHPEEKRLGEASGCPAVLESSCDAAHTRTCLYRSKPVSRSASRGVPPPRGILARGVLDGASEESLTRATIQAVQPPQPRKKRRN